MLLIRNQSSNDLALDNAVPTNPAGTATIPIPIISTKKVKIRPPKVIG